MRLERQAPAKVDLVPTTTQVVEGAYTIDCNLTVDDQVIPSQIIASGNTRVFQLQREPYRPSELFALMNSVAPMPHDNVLDVCFDLRIALGTNKAEPESHRLESAHAKHFAEGWSVIKHSAHILLDHLPVESFYLLPASETASPQTHTGRSTPKKAVGLISNKELKADLFERLKNGELIAEPPVVESDKVVLPDTPLAALRLLNGAVEYHTIANIQHEGNEALTALVHAPDDEVATAVILNSNRKLALRGTNRPKHGGVVPIMQWRSGDVPAFQFDRPEVLSPKQSIEYNAVVASSLIGALVFSRLTPEVSGAWPKEAGFTKDSRKTQSMGPLQATLLAALSGKSLAKGSFAQRVEDIVRETT